MLKEIMILALITAFPFAELRLSIPLGILGSKMDLPFLGTWTGFGLSWPVVFAVCVISNILVGLLVFFLLNKFVYLVTKIKSVDKMYQFCVKRTQHKIKEAVDKYGWMGVAVFIGIPLPGTGVYAGALGSHLIGLSYKKFMIANIVGVIIAGILVTIITLSGKGLFTLLFGG
jgi:uncharacterized membrane protein